MFWNVEQKPSGLGYGRYTPYWAGVAILLMGLLIFWSGRALLACSQKERLVLAEFPQYGGPPVTPEGNVETGACAVYYETPDSLEEIESYFVAQLTGQGWTVETTPPPGILVKAQRGKFFYTVYYESMELYPTPRPGTYLAVHVGQE
jgi:hypothetical protein